MREALQAYVKRVGELAEHVRGNEQATKQSLVGPLFTTLGYDLTDPRECIPECRVDFGPNRSIKPIDWAFLQNGHPIFFVEAKEVGKKLASFDEQLADHDLGDQDARRPSGLEERLGHGTHGTHGKEEEAPDLNSLVFSVCSVCSVFKKSGRTHERRLNDKVVEDGKPVLANAISEWAGQRTLTAVLDNPARSEPRVGVEAAGGGRIETTQEELAAYEVIRPLLGPSRPIAYEDTVSYFKIHLAERTTWVMSRLYLGRKRPSVWVPLPQEQVQALTPGLMLNTPQAGWTCITLNASGEIDRLGDVLRAAWDFQRAIHSRKAEEPGAESSAVEGKGPTAEVEVAMASGESCLGEPASEPFVG